jgi:2-keto-4-pentenoate hydratase
MDERLRRGMDAQLARWRALVAGGAARVGWKVGLNDARVQAHLQLSQPVVGHLTLATTLTPGSPHSLRHGTMVGAEAEVAIHLGRDVGAGAGAAEVADAIVGLAPAIELVDVDRPIDDLERIVADNVFHRAVLFGPTHPGASLAGITARVLLNGAAVETVDAAAVTGDLGAVVRLVADTLAECGEQLRAGDRIIGGSFTRPVWVAAGDVVGVELGALGTLALALTV